jgi:hypothetical protein
MNSGNSVQDESRCASPAGRGAGTAERLAGTASRGAGSAGRTAGAMPSQDADQSVTDDRQSRPRPRFQPVQDIQELVDQLAAVTKQLSQSRHSDS